MKAMGTTLVNKATQIEAMLAAEGGNSAAGSRKGRHYASTAMVLARREKTIQNRKAVR